MIEKAVCYFILAWMMVSGIMDILVGLTQMKREREMRERYDNLDTLRGIVWLVIGVILLMQ